MVCIICHLNIKKKSEYINTLCDCGFSVDLHSECFIEWRRKKNGAFCLICLNKIDKKNIQIKNKNKSIFNSCFRV